jgi:hypothetical protein
VQPYLSASIRKSSASSESDAFIVSSSISRLLFLTPSPPSPPPTGIPRPPASIGPMARSPAAPQPAAAQSRPRRRSLSRSLGGAYRSSLSRSRPRVRSLFALVSWLPIPDSHRPLDSLMFLLGTALGARFPRRGPMGLAAAASVVAKDNTFTGAPYLSPLLAAFPFSLCQLSDGFARLCGLERRSRSLDGNISALAKDVGKSGPTTFLASIDLLSFRGLNEKSSSPRAPVIRVYYCTRLSRNGATSLY